MAKSKKPAPKGGKKAAAPKKVAKRAPAKKKLTARQIDQFNADKMRADSAIAAGKAHTDKVFAQLVASVASAGEFGAAMSKPLHPTVEEQYLGGVMAEMVDLQGVRHPAADEQYAAAFAAVEAARAVQTPAPKRRWFARFRSAITGLFVKKSYAEANPTTTVREKVK